MNRENFYILLALPFQPPTDDPARIKAAIQTFSQSSARLLDDPATRSRAQRYLALIPEMESVMFDQAAREQEAIDAQEIRQKKVQELEAELHILEAKGYILPAEWNDISKKYRPYGFTKQDIQQRIKTSISVTAPKKQIVTQQPTAIPFEQAVAMEDNLLAVDKSTLYDFLGVDSTASLEQLQDKARRKHMEAFQSTEKGSITSATQMLAQMSITLFESAESKQLYDTYLSVNQYLQLNRLIQEEYQRRGVISSDTLISLVNYGVSTYGDSVLKIEDYIKRYCLAYNISFNVMSHNVVCPSCEHKCSEEDVICSICGQPLQGDCPNCGEPFDHGTAICKQCGFPLAAMGKALAYLGQAEDAIANGSWSTARRAVDFVQRYWPGHPQLPYLEEKCSRLEERYQFTLKGVEKCIEERRYYTAQSLIEEAEEWKIRLPKTLSKRVEQTLQNFEEKLAEKEKVNQINFEVLEELSGIVADSIVVDQLLSQFPPSPPERIKARFVKGKTLITWQDTKANSLVSYVVVRKENIIPLTAFDGDVIYEGMEHSFEDESMTPLVNYYYSVFTKRGHVYSEIGAVAPVPLMRIPELEDLRIVPIDHGAQLTWKPHPSLVEVKIWRKLGGNLPLESGEGISLENTRLDGYTDIKLQNDSLYWYYVIGVYATEQGTISSQGVASSVVPHELVSPIDHVHLTKIDDNAYMASWEGAPHDEIMLLASPNEPDFYLGQMVSTNDLLFRFQRLELESQTSNSASFRYNVMGGIYIFPVVVTGRYASVGDARYLTNVENVSDLNYRLGSDSLLISFQWPEMELSGVHIAWKSSGFPESAQDKSAEHIVCSTHEYQYNDGVLITEFPQGKYFFKIYSVFKASDGSSIYSAGVDLEVNNLSAVEVFYDITCKKQILSKNYLVNVSIYSKNEMFFPAACIVAKENSLPLHKDDGIALFEIAQTHKLANSLTLEYKVSELPENLYLRMFLLDEDYSAIRLLPAQELKLT